MLSQLVAPMVAVTVSVLNAIQPEPLHIEATAYCYGQITATGKPVREGYCAMARDNLGKIAVVYSEDMEYIGTYEVEDTGGDQRIKDGKVIDIYNPSKSWCEKFGRQKVIVYLYDAEG